MWAVSDLDDETLKRSKLEPQPGIQKAFDRAIALIRSQDKEPYAVIMPQGSLTIPLIE